MKSRHTIRKETANHVREDCTAKRGSFKGQLKELVRGSVEVTLNELLEAEAPKLNQAARYERNEQRQGYRSSHYSRNLTTNSGNDTLKVPKLKRISYEAAMIERYHRREDCGA